MLYFYIYFLIGKYLGENFLIYLIIKKRIYQTNKLQNNLKNLHSMVKIKNYNFWLKILVSYTNNKLLLLFMRVKSTAKGKPIWSLYGTQ